MALTTTTFGAGLARGVMAAFLFAAAGAAWAANPQITLDDPTDPKTIDEDTSGAFGFTVSDSDGNTINSVVASSNNQTLITNSSAAVSCNGAKTVCTVTVTPEPNATGTAKITIQASDSASEVGSRSFDVIVDPVPDASPDTASVDEDGSVLIDVLANDDQGSAPTPAAITIAAGGQVIGTAAVESSQVRYTPSPNANGPDSFFYFITDANGDASNTVEVSVSVNAINDAPSANAASATTDEDTAVTITLSGSDVDGDSLAFAIATGPSNGTLGAITSTGATTAEVTYTPNGDYNGSDSFTYTADDGSANSLQATVDVVINAVADAPSADAVSATTDEDTTVTITLSGSDADGDSLTFAVATGPSNGTLGAIASTGATTAEVTYTPNGDYNGSDSFTYTVNDSSADSAPATVDVTVNAINDAPSADAASATTDEDTAVTITLSGSDVDGDSLTFAVGTGPSNGTLGAITSTGATTAEVTYTPNGDYNGSDSFTYTADDGSANSLQATVDVVINAVADAPSADAVSATTDEDTTVTITLSGSDADGDSLTFAVATGPSNGTLGAIASTGATTAEVTYTPNGDYNGSDSFTYTVNDSSADSAPATVDVTVNAINDAPSADAASATTDEDTAVTITLSGSDVDGDSLTFAVATSPSNGTLGAITSTGATTAEVTYTPNGDYNGSDSFTYTAHDGTVSSVEATASVTVNAINDAPAAIADNYSVDEDNPLTVSAPGVLGNDDDVEGSGLNATLDSGVANGTLMLNSDGSFSYTPDPDFNGTDSFTYFANDGAVNSDTAATVTIAVNAVNDTPNADAASATTDEDTAVTITLSGSDVDGDSLTFAIATGPSNGTLGAITSTGATTAEVTYTPAGDYNGSDSFTYTAHDGTVSSAEATVSVTVNAVNDAPVANDDNYSVDEDDTLTVTAPSGVLVNDTDTESSSLTAVIQNGVTDGSLTLNSDGSFTYTPSADFNGTDSFTYFANDGTVNSDSAATVTITVNAVNDAPVANDDSYSVDEDNTLTIAAPGTLDNDADVDDDPLTAVLDTNVTDGTLTLNSDGSFSYTPNADFNGTDSFTYFAHDGTVSSDTAATVTITVDAVNDAPVANDDNYSVDEDDTLTVTAPSGVLVNDTDTESSSLTAIVQNGVTDGSLTLNSDGSFTYTPSADFNGTDSFTYFANDGTVNSDSAATVTITVNAVNDAPVANDDSYSVDEDNTLTIAAPGTLDNDADVDDDPLTAVLDTNVTDGTMTLNSDGSFSYTPNADFNGTDSFTYFAHDGTVSSGTAATVTITVDAVNDAPVANDDNYSVDEDDTLTVTAPSGVLVNDTDTESSSLTAVIQNGVTDGSLTLNSDGSFTYTPSADFNGTDSFTYFANDGTVNSDSAATVTITVNAVNDAPVANDDSYSVDEDNTLTIAAPGTLDNDADVDDDPLTAVLDTNVTDGTLTLNSDGSFSYTPNADFNGTDSFTYFAHDGTVSSDTAATVTITVDAVNDAPVLSVPGTQTITEDEQTAIPGISVTDVDEDESGGTNELEIQLSVGNGTLEVTASGAASVTGNSSTSVTISGTQADVNATVGALQYTTDPDFDGNDTLSINASDLGNTGSGGVQTDSASVNLDITPVNDDPRFVIVPTPVPASAEGDGSSDFGDPSGIDEDAASSGLVVELTDPDSPLTNLTMSVASGNEHLLPSSNVAVGPLSGEPGKFELQFVLATNKNELTDEARLIAEGKDPASAGRVEIQLFAFDGADGGSAAYNLVISTVNPINDPPQFNAVTTDPAVVSEDSGAQTVTNFITGIQAGPSTASDEIGSQALTFGLICGDDPAGDQTSGLFATSPAIDDGGTLSYESALHENGSAVCTVQLSDDGGTAGDATDDQTFVRDPADDFVVTIDPINDGPTAIADAFDQPSGLNQGFLEDDGARDVTGAVLANDEDPDLFPILREGDTRTVVSFDDTGTTGLVALNAGTLSYSPNGAFEGLAADVTTTDSFDYTMEDSGGLQSTATVTVTITGQNDAPIADDDAVTFDEDDPATDVSATLLAGDSDPDGDSFQITASGGAPTGLVFVIGGSLTYDPNDQFESLPSGQTGSDSFTYVINDGLADSAPATVTVTINGANDTPTITTGTLAVDEAQTVALTQGALDASDVDSTDGPSELTFTVQSLPGEGTLLVNGTPQTATGGTFTLQNLIDGLVTYEHDGSAVGDESDSIDFSVADDESASTAAATMNIAITAVDDTPTIDVAYNVTPSTFDEGTSTSLSFDLTVTNTSTGVQPVTIDTLSDSVLGDVTALAGSTCTVPQSLDDGESFTCSFPIDRTENADFTGYVLTASGTDEESDPASGTGTAAVTVNDVAPTISVTLTGASSVLEPGNAEDYTVTVENTSTASTDPVTLSAPVVSYTAPDGGTPAQSCGAFGNDTLNPGETTTCTISISQADLEGFAGDSANLSVTVNATDDESTAASDSASQAIAVTGTDFGDAPNVDVDAAFSYPTTIADDGARHTLGSDLLLGTAADAEDDGQPSDLADGDDLDSIDSVDPRLNTDDEDGVSFPTLQRGETADITVSVALPTGLSDARVNAWIDYDSDGAWDAGEQVLTNETVVAGANTLTLPTIPTGAVLGDAFARVRLCSAGETCDMVTGLAGDGEVEDYVVTVSNVDPVIDADPNDGENDADPVADQTIDEDQSPVPTVEFEVRDNEDMSTLTVEATTGNTNLFASPLTVNCDMSGLCAVDLASLQDANTPAFGTAGITVTATDSDGGTATDTFTVTVDPVNDAPTAIDDTAAANEDGPSVAIDVLGNDQDVDLGLEDDTQTVVGTGGTPAGLVTFDANGVTYDPNGAFEGLAAGVTTTDSFNYTMEDSGGLQSTATVTVTITGQNDAPIADDDAVTIDEDDPATDVSATLLAGDSDPDGDSFQITASGGAPTGTVSVAGGVLTYDPNDEFESLPSGQTGSDSFTYVINDGLADSAPATVTVTINGANDTPTITTGTLALDEAQTVALTTAALDASDVDNNDGANELTFTVEVLPTNGTLQIGGVDAAVNDTFLLADLGTVTYTHDGGTTTTDSAQFSVADNESASTAAATMNIAITAVDDTPTIDVAYSVTPSTFDEGTSTSLSFDLTVTNTSTGVQPVTIDTLSDSVLGDVTALAGSTCTVPQSLDDGESFTCSFPIDRTENADFTGYVLTASGTDEESDPASGTGTAAVTVNDVAPTIAVSLTGAGSVLEPGNAEDYTVTVENTSTASTDPVTLSAPVVSYTAPDGGTPAQSCGAFGNDTLNPGETTTCTISIAEADLLGFAGDSASLSVTVNATDDESTAASDSASQAIAVTGTDFGDAPDSTIDTAFNYPTVLGADGARHTLGDGLLLGTAVDAEDDGQPSEFADGDDFDLVDTADPRLNAADEDGVLFPMTLARGETEDIMVDVSMPTGMTEAYVNVWIDFNYDGTWSAGERVLTDATVGAGSNPLSLGTIPTDAVLGETYARVRLCSTVATCDTVSGLAVDGEVEDYLVDVSNVDPVIDADPNDGENDADPVADQTIDEDQSPVPTVEFEVRDNEDMSTLTVEATTGNTNLFASPLTVNCDMSGLCAVDLASVQDANTPASGTADITVTATDSDGGTATDTFTVTVDPVNDAPIGVNDSASVPEDGPDVTLTVTGNDTDVDLSREGDDLRITQIFIDPALADNVVQVGDDQIRFTPNGEFEALDDGEQSIQNFSYEVSDLAGAVSTADVQVTVLGSNDAPTILGAPSYTIAEDGALNVNVAGFASDPDNDPLVFGNGTSAPSNGNLNVQPNGSLSYTPDADFNGSEFFTVLVSDDNSATAEISVAVTVTEVNDAPIAVDDTLADVDEDEGPYAISGASLTGNDSRGSANESGQSLTVTSATIQQPAAGSATVSGGSVTVTVPQDYSGPVSFEYTVIDDGTTNGSSDPLSDSAVASFQVNEVNDPPVAVDDAYSVDEDAVLNVAQASGLLANDTDAEDDALTAGLVTGPSNGTITVNSDGSFTYTPAADFNGSDTFTYSVSDAEDGDNGTVSITVNPINDDPVANDDLFEVDEDETLTITAPGVIGNDVDVDGDDLAVTLASDVTNGTLTLNGDGSFTYTPDADFNGTDEFAYTLEDGEGGSAPGSSTITVNPVNDAPVLEADPADRSVAEDAAIGADVGAPLVVDDVDDTDFTFSITSGNIGNVFAIDAGGQLAVADSLDFETRSVYNLTIQVSDSELSDTTTVQVNIIDVAENVDLAVMQTVDVNPADDGDVVNFTLTVTNNGPGDVTSAPVTSTLAPQLANAGWVCMAETGASCPASGNGAIDVVVDLEEGASVVFTITAEIEDDGSLSTQAISSVATPDGLGDTNPANNSATTTVSIGDDLFSDSFEQTAQLSLSKSAYQSETVDLDASGREVSLAQGLYDGGQLIVAVHAMEPFEERWVRLMVRANDGGWTIGQWRRVPSAESELFLDRYPAEGLDMFELGTETRLFEVIGRE